jgi:release factor glutamine methyltransferase
VALARANAARNGVGERVEVVEGDLWAPVGERVLDVVVSNPPYIRTGELAGLDREVQREPRLALDGGADGLAIFRRLIAELPAHVAGGGLVAFEHGHDQGDGVRALLDETGAFAPAATERDLAKLPRVTWARRR